VNARSIAKRPSAATFSTKTLYISGVQGFKANKVANCSAWANCSASSAAKIFKAFSLPAAGLLQHWKY
jgi:hypothetical protein